MRLYLSAAVLAFTGVVIACNGQNASNVLQRPDEPIELPSHDFVSGSFNLGPEPQYEPGPCSVYTTLELSGNPDAQDGAVASLRNAQHRSPNAFCPAVAIPPDLRSYKNLEIAKNGCGTVTMIGSDGENSITITDHRQLTCRIAVQAQLIVEETRNGSTNKLYSFSNDSGQTQPTSAKVLSCTETATFADGPGFTYLVAIGVNATAFINSKAVQLRGQPSTSWQVKTAVNNVTESSDGSLAIAEHKEPINWAEEGSCYKFVRQFSMQLQKSEDGYKGSVTDGGYIARDPSIETCDHPLPQPARPREVSCSLY